MAILPLLSESDPIVWENADAGGDEFDNTEGHSKLQVWNQTAGDLRLTFVEKRPCSFGEIGHDSSTLTISAGVTSPVGKFQVYRYNSTFHRVEVTYPDGVVGLKVCATYRP